MKPHTGLLYDNQTTGYRGLRTNTHTCVVHATDGKTDEVLLFDHQEDPYQINNIASEQPRLIRSFEGQLKRWLTATNDPCANYLP